MTRRLIAFFLLAGLALPASAQVSMPLTFESPDGQKQFGPYTWVWKSKSFQPAYRPLALDVRCPPGEVVLGGGVKAGPLFTDLAFSRPTGNFDGWHVYFYQKGQGGTFTVTVYASCAAAQ